MTTIGTSVPLQRRLFIGLGAILWFVLTLLFLLGLVVLSAWPLWVLGAIALLAVVVAIPLFLIRWFIARGNSGYNGGLSFLAISLGLFMALSAAIAIPVYYFAFIVDSRPTTMPLATLSNGKKTVVFQGMQHVASEGFYKSVVFDLEKALTEGYMLFYEGVQPSPDVPGADKWFSNTFAGGGDLSGNYQKLADVCGLQFQLAYFEPLSADMKVRPELHRVADVSYADMKAEYDRLVREEPSFEAAFAAETGGGAQDRGNDTSDDVFKFLLGFANDATAAQRKQVGFICRGFMNMALAAPGEENWARDKVLLFYRNKRLAQFIQDAPEQKIYITYGANHLPGLIDEMKALDPAWTLESIKWARVMSNPEELGGSL